MIAHGVLAHLIFPSFPPQAIGIAHVLLVLCIKCIFFPQEMIFSIFEKKERKKESSFLNSTFHYFNFQISDIRERHYEKMGIGSSYLFRLDDGYVVSK